MNDTNPVAKRRGAPKGGWPKRTAQEVGEPQKMGLDPETPPGKLEGAVATLESDEANESRIVNPTGLKKTYLIYIHKQENTDHNRPIFIPNHDGGKDWVLPRGKEIWVPEYVVNILKEATSIHMKYDFPAMNIPGQVRPTVSAEKIPRFAFDIRREEMV